MKTLLFSIFICCGIASHGQTVDVARSIQEARELQAAGDAEKSLTLLNTAYEACTFTKPRNNVQLAEINSLMGRSYAMKYEWSKAIRYGIMASKRVVFAPKAAVNALINYNLASAYAGRGEEDDYVNAIRYVMKSMSYYDKGSVEYFECYNDLVYYYLLANKKEEALDCVNNAIHAGTLCYRNDETAYIKELQKYASMISDLDDNNLAITYAKACLDIMERNGQIHSRQYISQTIKLAGFYYYKRDFQNEITTLAKIVQVSKEMDGELSANHVDCLRKLALAYNHQENEIRKDKGSKALADSCKKQNQYYEGLAREILIKTGNINEIRSYQIPLISNQAYKLSKENKYPEAIRLAEIAYKLYGRDRDSLRAAQSASNIANYYYYGLKQLDSALYYGRMSTNLYDSIPLNFRNKGISYNHMAVFTHDNGNVEEAITYAMKAVNTLKLCQDTISKVYIRALGNAGVFYNESGDEKNGALYTRLSEKAMETARNNDKQKALAEARKLGRKQRKVEISKIENTHHIDYSMVLSQWNKAMCAEDPTDLHDAYSKAYKFQRDMFLQEFPAKTTNARDSLWGKAKFIYNFAETLAFMHSKNDSIATDAYNAILIRDAMPGYIEKCDSAAILYDFKSQSASLPANTAIVRFFIVPTDNKGDTYSAFVICKEWPAPKVFKQMFTEKDLELLKYDSIHSFKDIYKTVEGRKLISGEGRFGRMVWRDIITSLDSTVTEIRYYSHGVGLFDELDPATYCLEENEPALNQKFRMVQAVTSQ